MKMTRTVWLMVLAGALVSLLTSGVRHSFGLYLRPMTLELEWGREVFGFAIAWATLLMGICTPFMGWISDRYGAGRVILTGALVFALGLFFMSRVATPFQLILSLGLLIGLALSATSMVIVMSAVGRRVAEERRTLAMAIVSIGAAIGQVTMLPVGQLLIDGLGWRMALWVAAAMALLVIPLSLPFFAAGAGPPAEAGGQGTKQALVEAGRHRGFLLLMAGFFVCGFHVSFVAVHLPAFVVDKGLSATLGANALMLIGLFNILGSFVWGRWGDRYSKKHLLAVLYLMRALIFVPLVLVPVTPTMLLLFSAALGFTWLGTVPLTSALVGQIFGVQYLSTLFGIVFVSHQMGGFLGAWLGGYVYDLTGSYDPMWYGSIALGVVSALLHWPIDERTIVRARPAGQQG